MAFAASVAFLLGLCALLSYYFRNSGSDKSTNQASIASQNGSGGHERYLAFRNNYLFVYLCMMGTTFNSLTFATFTNTNTKSIIASDWLQGPYVYALYKSYNYGLDAIGVLFIVGFLSSALFGTVISSLADRQYVLGIPPCTYQLLIRGISINNYLVVEKSFVWLSV